MTTAKRIAALRSAIFAACRAQGIDNDTRRAIIQAHTGHASLTQCSADDMEKVLTHLNRGRGGYQGRTRSRPSKDCAALRSKIDALLTELHHVTGKVHTLKYADAIAQKHGMTCIDMADEEALYKVVGALSRTLKYRQEAARSHDGQAAGY